MPVSKNRRKGKKRTTLKVIKPKQSDPMVSFEETPDSMRLSMEKMMGQLQQGMFDGSLDSDPLSEAQDMMYDAWECNTKRERVALAKQALEISDQCADAYVMLAGETKDIIAQRNYLEKGVKAGELALGEEAFDQDVGHFWGILETRPYMRARAGLADCLWNMGEREEAVQHWREMLHLNPGDNQGLRSILGPRLLALNKLDEAQKLLDAYTEPSFAEWSYSNALLKFKQNGQSSAADKALGEAIKNNPFVPPYLLGQKRLPRTTPEGYTLGSKEEAFFYVLTSLESWKTTKGAMQWLDMIAKTPCKN